MKFIKRLFFIAIIVIIAIVAIRAITSKNDTPQIVVNTQYQKKAPSIQEYPRIVQTSSRAYYVATFTDNGRVITLTNYAYYDRKKWQHSEVFLPLDRNIYGPVLVINRQQGG